MQYMFTIIYVSQFSPQAFNVVCSKTITLWKILNALKDIKTMKEKAETGLGNNFFSYKNH